MERLIHFRTAGKRMARIGAAVLACLVALAAPVHACEIVPDESLHIAAVDQATVYRLTDGRVLRLEGLGSPRAPARSNGPFAIEQDATQDVATMLRGARLSVARLAEPDRYGRHVAQAWLDDGTWLNGMLVSQGLARVETLPGEVRCAAELLALEAEARADGRGIWRLASYHVLSPVEAAAYTNDFEIVEGTVLSAAEVNGRIYLNFGEDWRTDFTLTIAPGDTRAFERAGLEPLSWAGLRLRARGWLSWYNGPQIELDHPEQVELLGQDQTLGGDAGEEE